MIVSTFLNIVFIPVLYVVVQTLRSRVGGEDRAVEGNWPAAQPLN
jgi:hypothetical protein